RGVLITPDGQQLRATFSDPEQRAQIAQYCLGETLRNGVVADAGFFFGPKGFYTGLRELPATQRKMFAMRGISFVNELYGHEWELKVAQRRHSRFVNTTMMVTGLGAAVSDALSDGRVVSGVGGQYNFVAMAHALPEARSILCLRSTRTADGVTSSNIVWSYGHCTIPRHLRDIVVTEYGIADLRSRTDREIVEALVGIMDARFQRAFVADAQRAGKLPKDWRIPEAARANTPQQLANKFAPWRERGLFAELPFGTDFTAEEIVLSKALRLLQASTQSWSGRMRTLLDALLNGTPEPAVQSHLARMGLARTNSLSQVVQRRLLTTALRKILQTS
ncbi:MAG TPA: acetyl-CoA hydrolase/transferase C-terminal domain-containing protein, partial [Steroidobacter sp.]|nr:acetyl-CoA hydrolase/transferase C-terminal domain-containing protein [Steroidobacter sp.]